MKTHRFLKTHNNLIILFFISSLYSLHLVQARRELLNVNSPSSNDDHNAKGRQITISPSVALILILLAILFAIIGWILICYKQFPGTSFFDAPSVEDLGLDHNIINTFPTLLYSDVKKFKLGKGTTLECAVCLDEFRDDGETLRLLPKCSHLYHRECIDLWLVDHTTCPVCRANLAPNPDDLTKEEHPLHESEIISSNCAHQEVKIRMQRSYTTGHSMVQVSDDNYERYTLRMSDEVRRQLLMAQPTLQRTVSLASWPRFPSSPRGYRSQGTGSSLWSTRIRGDERHNDAEFGV